MKIDVELGQINLPEVLSSAIQFFFRAKDALSWEKLGKGPRFLNGATRLENYEAGCVLNQFVPYYQKLPWHNGSRAFLSRFFPKYGNYCGPNWSSGRAGGSLFWDKPPTDGLDFCCYKHDIGYDSHNQLDLYNADLAMCQCLLSIPRARFTLNPQFFLAEIYRSAALFGLKMILVPYRSLLLKQIERESQRQRNKKDKTTEASSNPIVQFIGKSKKQFRLTI